MAVLAALALGALALLPLHDDAWWNAMPRPRQWWLAFACVLAYAGFCVRTWRSSRHASVTPWAAADTDVPMLVAYASQTGFARELAERTAATLQAAGVPGVLRALGDVDAALLARCRRVLFVASTTGEGDPPDHAQAFVAGTMTGHADLSGLEYAVLALGDREYGSFCGFGHQLDEWLRGCGASTLFDLTEVDNGDPGALRHWQHHLGLLGNTTDLPDWSPPRYDAWTMQERRLLNPGSAGGAAFEIALVPPAGDSPTWQAGDIVEIGPCNAAAAVEALLQASALPGDTPVQADGMQRTLHDVLLRARLPAAVAAAARGLSAQALADSLSPLPHREYSIASLPAEGPLRLLVRRMPRPDGTPGIGSGWLCEYASPGATIFARLRANPNFHAPSPERPMILVGNGTGIAGLRAHLAARIAAGERRNWLLSGERNASHDAFYRDEIACWQREGWLQRLDMVFSRDGRRHRYVQDALLAASDELREWASAGAAIYVCGSLQGMAPAVDAVLRATLGDPVVDAMLADGRYRRDVY